MSEIKAVAYQVREKRGVPPDKWMNCSELAHAIYQNFSSVETRKLYTQEQLDKAIEERDILIRDLRKELNERRYGRSANR